MADILSFLKSHQGEGGKAAGLRLLKKAGCRVPSFTVLKADFFSGYLDYAGQRIKPDLKPKLEKHIDQWFSDFSGNPWPLAVRSSAVGEDGSRHSYAGILDTVLHVNSKHALIEAIHTVVSGIWSQRVMAYRKEKNIGGELLPAVIIQKEIEADYSGVMFTTFPLYPNELMIHLTKGYGDKLVGGEVDPIEVAFDRASGKVSHFDQEIDKAPKATLLFQIFQEGMRLEKWRKHPLDIEFCICDGIIYFLQMRAITVAIPPQRVLDNSNIQESYCGATTELTFGFARKAYQTVYTQTMSALGMSGKEIDRHKDTLSNLLERYKGNIYYNINNWYRGLQLLPSFKQNKADMERMMGLEEPVDFVVSRRSSILTLAKKSPQLIVNFLRLIIAFKRLKKDTADFQEAFKIHFEDFYQSNPAQLTLEECNLQYHRLNSEILDRWHVPIVNDFYVMMQNGKVHRQLKKSGIHEPETWLQKRLISDGNLPSLEPTKELNKLGIQVRKNKDFLQLLRENPADLHKRVSISFPEEHRAIEDYIHKYGDRTIGELKLETKTMRVDPEIFYKYLRSSLENAEIGWKNSADEDSALPAANLKKLKEGIFRREALRLERTRLFGMYRSIMLRTGAILTGEGKLPSPEHIFYLNLWEFEEVLKGQNPPLTEEIIQREKVFQSFEEAVVPSRVYIPGREPKTTDSQNINGPWQGQAAVAGMAQGEVICVKNNGDWNDLKGKIICALRTDPGWAPLFPGCKGVIIEKGSALSHSIIILGELGIPTIINIPGITQLLSTGDNVCLDANSGKIQKL